MKNSEHHILIAGYYGRRNAGDEVILQGILSTLERILPPSNFVVVSSNPEETIKMHSVRAVAWSDIEGLIDAVKNSSLVIVGGGGLFHDYWGFNETGFLSNYQGGISEFGSPLLIAHMMGKPSMLYGVGVGPLFNNASQKAVRLLCEIADDIVLRDEISKQILNEIGFNIERVKVAADPAFCAPSKRVDSGDSERLKSPRPRLGVSVRPWTFNVNQDQWETEVAEALDRFLDVHGGTVIFNPMQDGLVELEDDVSVCEHVRARMRNVTHSLIVHSNEPLERLFVLENCDLVLGMRLHSVVAAFRGGVPCVALVYDPKVRALMDQAGVSQYAMNVGSADGEALSSMLCQAYQERVGLQTHLEHVADDFAHQAGAIAERVKMLLTDVSSPKERADPLIASLLLDRIQQLMHAEVEIDQLKERIQTVECDFQQAVVDLRRAEKALDSTRDQLSQTATLVGKLQSAIEKRDHDLQRREAHLVLFRRQAQDTEAERNRLRSAFERSRRETDRIKASMGWKILQSTWSIVWRLREVKEKIKRSLKRISFPVGIGFAVLRMFKPLSLRFAILTGRSSFSEGLDKTDIILITENADIIPNYSNRMSASIPPCINVCVSLVVIVKNEEENILEWFREIENQTRLPDEIVIIENCSTDRSIELIQARLAETPLESVKLYTHVEGSVARCRNLGVKTAQHNVIAMTDFGCGIPSNWLDEIILPFEIEPEMFVVAGWYEPKVDGWVGKNAQYELVPRLEHLNPQEFLPATRSIAFCKSAWERVGGFPEWLSYAGEDTYFASELKRVKSTWAFVPSACVRWQAPNKFYAVWSKLVTWAAGDGESGVFTRKYFSILSSSVRILAVASFISLLLTFGLVFRQSWLLFLSAILTLLATSIVIKVANSERKDTSLFWFLIGRAARLRGYIQGIKNRPIVLERKYENANGVVFILSGVPIDDTGGGSRASQIAQEFLKRGYLTVYIYKFQKQESINLDLDFHHTNLMHFSLDDFDWDAFRWGFAEIIKNKPISAIIEFPERDFVRIVDHIRNQGGTIVYDLIDDWETSLGGNWFSDEVEEKIIERSHMLVASAPSLVSRLEQRSGRHVVHIPNAVNATLFNRLVSYEHPEDLPRNKPIILYVGALWGEWFDWDLLTEVCLRYLEASVVVIGDYRGQCTFSGDNLHFLGLKPQSDLPAYLAHADIGIIPWKVDPITQSASPLKVYEYLAMGLPVVAPNLRTLEGVPYVFLADSQEGFIEAIEDGLRVSKKKAIFTKFKQENTWEKRVDQLIRALNY